MKIKHISFISLGMSMVLSMYALERSITLTPNASGQTEETITDNVDKKLIGGWESSGLFVPPISWGMPTLKAGPIPKSRPQIQIKKFQYQDKAPIGANTDLLLFLDNKASVDESGKWQLSYGKSFRIDKTQGISDVGSGSFSGRDSAIQLVPGDTSVIKRGGFIKDFSIEFWLFPLQAQDGEIILMLRSIIAGTKNVAPQQISCEFRGRQLVWKFYGIFTEPDSFVKGDTSDSRFELASSSALVPKVWSHHLIRYNTDGGYLEYLKDGKPEDAQITSSAKAGLVTLLEPFLGPVSAITLGTNYSGLLNYFRISKIFVEDINTQLYATKASKEGSSSWVRTPIIDMGYSNSVLKKVVLPSFSTAAGSIEMAYRIGDSWKTLAQSNTWIPLQPGQSVIKGPTGRFVQLQADFYPDGYNTTSPRLENILIVYEPDTPPLPPARLVATAGNGTVHLTWAKVLETDLGGYLVYYGSKPGNYSGTLANQGPSPIDVGKTTSFTLTGLTNGEAYYIVVAAYDTAPIPSLAYPLNEQSGVRSGFRAGSNSNEVFARPSRSAP